MPCIRQGEQRIAGKRYGCRDRIGLAAKYGLTDRPRVGHTCHVRKGRVHIVSGETTVGLCVFLPSGEPEKGILIGAQLLGPLPWGEGPIELQLVVTDDLADRVSPTQGFPSRHIQVPRNRPEQGPRPGGLGGVHTLLIKTKTPGDDRRPCHGIEPGRFDHLLRGEPRDLCHPLRGVRRYSGLQILKSDGPVCHKVAVVELILNNHSHPAEHQGHIGSRPDLEEHVRFFRLGDATGIHHDESSTVLLGRKDHGIEADGIGLGRRMAPQDHALCLHHIAPGKAPIGGVFHGLAGAHADIVGPADVRRTEQIIKSSLIPVVGPFGAMGECQGLRAISIAQGRQVL